MLSAKKMQDQISIILLIGTLLSAILVLCGGIFYLTQHGNENIQMDLLQLNQMNFQPYFIWTTSYLLSAIGMIKLGLFILVATQICRVTLLTIFYLLIRDYYFILISTFILFILLYSIIWR